jgi:hypothetical protein
LCIMAAVFPLSLASTPVDYCQDISINSEYKQSIESDLVTLVLFVLRSNVHRSQACLMLQLTSSLVHQRLLLAGKMLKRTVVLLSLPTRSTLTLEISVTAPSTTLIAHLTYSIPWIILSRLPILLARNTDSTLPQIMIRESLFQAMKFVSSLHPSHLNLRLLQLIAQNVL